MTSWYAGVTARKAKKLTEWHVWRRKYVVLAYRSICWSWSCTASIIIRKNESAMSEPLTRSHSIYLLHVVSMYCPAPHRSRHWYRSHFHHCQHSRKFSSSVEARSKNVSQYERKEIRCWSVTSPSLGSTQDCSISRCRREQSSYSRPLHFIFSMSRLTSADSWSDILKQMRRKRSNVMIGRQVGCSAEQRPRCPRTPTQLRSISILLRLCSSLPLRGCMNPSFRRVLERHRFEWRKEVCFVRDAMNHREKSLMVQIMATDDARSVT